MDRKRIVETAIACLGTKEGTIQHKTILDIYNNYKPNLYHMKPTDAWCATFVSACFIAQNLAHLIPVECSCLRMVSKAITMGIWQENDGYIPKCGDIIMYAWKDNGIGDCKLIPNHTGIVENVVSNHIYVIEGNKNDKVERRVIGINAKFIRGYITPRYK